MIHKMSRELFWTDKTSLEEFLQEPLNQKLYDVYLNIKKNSPSQNFHTLDLFNEVYYLSSMIVQLNEPNPDLNDYVTIIKNDMGWDYHTSIVMNMVYVILSLRKGNSDEVCTYLNIVRKHYRMDNYKTPFTILVEEELGKNHDYEVVSANKTIEESIARCLNSTIPSLLESNDNRIQITLNVNNQFTGEIKSMQVAHSDVAVGVAERGSKVYHHNNYHHGRK